MGAVHVDLNKREREYEVKYPLDNPFGVRALFEDYHRLWRRVFDRGDYDALLVILDFVDALYEARLTTKQKEALYLVYMVGMTQEDASSTLGVSQQALSVRVENAINRVAESQGFDKEVFIEKHGH